MKSDSVTIRRFFVIPFFGAILFILPSCFNKPKSTPIPTDTAQYQKGYEDCNEECKNIQKQLVDEIRKLQQELALKNQVLKRFNQVDEKGNLYVPPSRSWDDAPDGSEDWQK